MREGRREGEKGVYRRGREVRDDERRERGGWKLFA